MPHWVHDVGSFSLVLAISAAARGLHRGVERGRPRLRHMHAARNPRCHFAAYSTPREVYDSKIIPAFQVDVEGRDRRRAAVLRVLHRLDDPSPERGERVRRRCRGSVARARRRQIVRRRSDHPRLDRSARQGHGLELGRRVRRPARQPEGLQDWNDLAAAGRRGPHARPRTERRRSVEPRVPVGLGAARRRAGHQQGRRGRRDDV